mmetsp:Transcript_22511/g.44478  ORF Transcript_22511/g.44478 Transcript_22511/m.44478 type:complete len:239 (+) Transcript_22511:630-1346(+)
MVGVPFHRNVEFRAARFPFDRIAVGATAIQIHGKPGTPHGLAVVFHEAEQQTVALGPQLLADEVAVRHSDRRPAVATLAAACHPLRRCRAAAFSGGFVAWETLHHGSVARLQESLSHPMHVRHALLVPCVRLQSCAQLHHAVAVGAAADLVEELHGPHRPQPALLPRVHGVVGVHDPHHPLKLVRPPDFGITEPRQVLGLFQDAQVALRQRAHVRAGAEDAAVARQVAPVVELEAQLL